jgi:deazaflavin-dependent oxidoreductase (nitroreductase family)
LDMKEINRRVIEQFRAGADIDGMHRDRIVLLTTTGRHSGHPHTTPMMFHRDGDRVLVIASNSGDPKDPDWYRNLLANPEVTVEIGNDRYQAQATPARGAEYDHLWAMIKQTYPFFADHEIKANRTIPVVILERAE